MRAFFLSGVQSDMAFQDHFSAQAGAYAQHRPSYPSALYAHLQRLVGRQARVWEAACGSGQATVDLSRRFDQVYATEPSASALEHAPTLPGVRYECASAEDCALPAQSVDLIVVAQALHWFDQPAFFAQCERVLRPGGVLAVWCYQDFQPPPAIAAACAEFRGRIEPYWPAERRLIDIAYADSPWPFGALQAPLFPMTAQWKLSQLLGYLSSYSAVIRCGKATGNDPVRALADQFAAQWGEADRRRRIRWPLHVHLRSNRDQETTSAP